MLTRRHLLHRSAVVACGALAIGILPPIRPSAWAAPSAQSFGPPLPDPAGLLDLPNGFSYTVLIRSGQQMVDGRVFLPDPDLGAVVDLGDGTFYLVIGHEIRADMEYGGAFTGSATRLQIGPGNQVLDSRLLASGMRNNCSGVATPWGTILSAEENPRGTHESNPDEGYLWEIDPRSGEKWRREAMGRYSHESAAVDQQTGVVYCTGDSRGGPFYKFVPDRPGDLASGALFAFRAADRSWLKIGDPYDAHAEALARGATAYNRHEDLEWGRDGKLYIAETGNETGPVEQRDPFGRIRRFDPRSGETDVFVEGGPHTLINPDNITSDRGGSFYICEDKPDPMLAQTGDNNVVRVTPEGATSVFATLRGKREPSGVVFSPDQRTLFLNVLESEGAVLAITGF
jgi:secreted PhoX family phosphatase